LLRANQSAKASAIVAKELFALAFKDEAYSRTKLLNKGIEVRDWKQSIYRVLRAGCHSAAPSWNEWITEIRMSLESELQRIVREPESLGRVLKKDSENMLRTVSVEQGTSANWPGDFQSLVVHQAKGMEFASVIYFQPKPHANHDPCPSTQWFAPSEEEKRIAYVAVTRSKELFILCLHKKTYDALLSQRSSFVGLFDVIHLV
jgi:superfamily I DNA/RNA helicase